MNMDPLIAAELQIFASGLIIALVGWYFLRREKEQTRPGKDTSATKVSPTR